MFCSFHVFHGFVQFCVREIADCGEGKLFALTVPPDFCRVIVKIEDIHGFNLPVSFRGHPGKIGIGIKSHVIRTKVHHKFQNVVSAVAGSDDIILQISPFL